MSTISKKILILGGRGNLGSQLAKALPDSLVWDREEIDVTEKSTLEEKIKNIADEISTVINCVAYNDVDGAESNREIAFILNAELPKNLAKICKELNLLLVHYSTGYVFSGNKESYIETDTPDPISVYAESKAEGEKAIIGNADKFYIIRTNVLFGPVGESPNVKPSVVDIMRKRGTDSLALKGIVDERASFTYTPDLAHATKELLDSGRPYGIYHLTNEGSGTWYDLACEIFKRLGYKVLESPSTATVTGKYIVISKVPGSEFPRPAKRPKSSVLENSKAPKLRDWRDALAEYVR